MLCLGIDWSVNSHTISLFKNQGQVLLTLTIPNSYQGYLKLLETIRKYSGQQHPQQVLFAIETKNLRLVDFLLANGFVGYYVEPNKMDSYRRRYKSSGVKDDIKDSFVLGDVLLRDRDNLPLISPDSELIRELKALLSDREGFIREQTRLTNRLIACLRQYYPEALEFFQDVTGKTALEFIETYPSFQQAKGLSLETVKQFLSNHHSYQHQRLEHIMAVLSQPPIPIPEVIVRVKQRLALELIHQIRVIQQTVSAYDKEIERISADNDEIKRFDGLPGAGLIISCGLYTLLGEDRMRFNNVNDVQSFIGTSPRTIQSGQLRKVCFRFGCSHTYRALLVQLALSSLRSSVWARYYYKLKRREGKGHYHALRCLGNLWMKIVFAMWRNRTDYNEDYHLAQITRHQIKNELVSSVA